MAAGFNSSLRLWKVIVMLMIVLGYGQARFLEVENGRDFHSKCSLMHLASDLTGLKLKKSFSMDDLQGLPQATIPSDLMIVGDGNTTIVSIGDCTSGISVEPGVKLEVQLLTLDMGECAMGLARNHGVDGWVFNLGRGSQQLINRSTIILESEALDVLSERLGKTILPGEPQNFTLTSGGDSRSVRFASVIFKTRDREASSSAPHHPIIFKLETTLDLIKLVELRNIAQQTEAWIPKQLMGPCSHELLLNPINSFQPGTSLRIKPEHPGIGLVDCPMDYFGPGVLEAYEYVSGEDLFLSTSDEFSYSGLPQTPDLNWYWEEVFPVMLGDYSCRFVLRNSIIYSNSENIGHWTIGLKKYNQWSPITLQALYELQQRAPYLKMDVDGRLTLRIETLAWNGVCMENVTVTSDRLLVSKILKRRLKYDRTDAVTHMFPILGCLYLLLSMVAVSACCYSRIQIFWCKKNRKSLGSQNHSVTVEDCHSAVPCAWTTLTVASSQEQDEGSRLSEKSFSTSDEVSEHSEASKELNDALNIHYVNERGSSAVSYHGEWKGVPVEIKRIDFESRVEQNSLERYKRVLDLATRPELLHENVLQTLAYCSNPVEVQGLHYVCHRCTSLSKCSSYLDEMQTSSLFVAREHCDKGSLYRGLRNKIFNDPVTRLVNTDTIVKLCLGIARGVQHLHACGIVHGELTSKNVLLKSHDHHTAEGSVTPKIANFGVHGHAAATNKELCGHEEFSSGLFHNESSVFCQKADVLSFGALLWEMFNDEQAYDELCRGYTHTVYPRFPAHCPKLYAVLCITCLSPNPENRPDFSQIICALGCLKNKQQSMVNPCAECMDAKSAALVESLCGSDLLKLLAQLTVDDTHYGDRTTKSSQVMQGSVPHTSAECTAVCIVGKGNRPGRIIDRKSSIEEYFQTGNWTGSDSEKSVVINSEECHVKRLEQHGLFGWSLPYSYSPLTSQSCSEAGSSNAFSVAIEDELNDGKTDQAAHGELKFRWSPFILQDAANQGAETIHSLIQAENYEDYVKSLQEPSNRIKITIPQTKQALSLDDGADLAEYHLLTRERAMSEYTHSDESLGDVTRQRLKYGSWECTGSDTSRDVDDISYEYTNPPVAAAGPVYLSQNPIFIPYPMDTGSW